jgi:hypothetical protein
MRPVHRGKKITQRLLAGRRIRLARPQRGQSTVDRPVDDMPLPWRAWLEGGFRLIPGCLQILYPSLRASEIAPIDQCRRIDDNEAERREIAER